MTSENTEMIVGPVPCSWNRGYTVFVTRHPGQLSLADPPWMEIIDTEADFDQGINRHWARFTTWMGDSLLTGKPSWYVPTT